jgi:hypothetical protein
MHDVIHYITHVPASSWYHLAAFLLTGAFAQYSVQIIKIVAKNKLGKRLLQLLNGTFTTLYTAAGAILTGGMSLGNLGKTSLALATVSAIIYRIHDNVLYKKASTIVNDALVEYDKPPANRFGEPLNLDETQETFTLAHDRYLKPRPPIPIVRFETPKGTPVSAFEAED